MYALGIFLILNERIKDQEDINGHQNLMSVREILEFLTILNDEIGKQFSRRWISLFRAARCSEP
jgi:hypothetical protein